MTQRNDGRVLIALVAGLALGSACSLYNPTLKDCSVQCGEGEKCPAGSTCKEGFCRPEGATGYCDCNVGDTQVCGTTKGECRVGQRICLENRVWGPCLGEVKATFEVCDGKDNDCDGTTDEDVSGAPECPLSLGVCDQTTQQCVDGGFSGSCGPSSYGPDYEALEQRCDGLDNDCDGNVDSRAAVRLQTGADMFAAEAVPGGYFLFWAQVGTTIISAQRFDDRLQTVGSPGTVDVGGANLTRFLSHASQGGTVALGFQRIDGTIGVIRLSTSAAVPMLLDAPQPTSEDWALAVLPTGAVRGAFERDGGVMMATWDLTTSAVTVAPRTLRRPVTRVTGVSLTSDGTVLAWDGDYDDGGTSERTGGVEQVEGSMTTAQTGASYGTILSTPGRLQSFRSFSTFISIFPFNINESGLTFCSDLWSITDTCETFNKANDYERIHHGTATRVGDDMVVGWLDGKTNAQLNVGIALPSVQQVRSRVLQMTGAVADFGLAAPPGSTFITVFYRPIAEPRSVFAMLMCPP
ncbi:MAG: MopE-related protein [Myxococcota bacterium]